MHKISYILKQTLLTAFVFLLHGLNCYALDNATLDAEAEIDIQAKHYEGAKNCWWYSEQANYKYNQNDFAGAIQDYSNAIALSPDVPDFYYNRGNIFSINNQPDRALLDYHRALELNPDYLLALNNQGWEYLKRKEYYAALLYLINYIKLVPSNPSMFLGFGKNDTYTNVLNNLGWESIEENKLPQALRYFNNYIEIKSNKADAYLGMALVYFNYSDFEKAIFYLDEAKEKEPLLYQGYSSIASLEEHGSVFSDKVKAMLRQMFFELADKKEDFKHITLSSAGKFTLGFMYVFLGVIAMFLFLFRVKRFEGYIFYLSLLNFCFGIRFLYDNPLIHITELPSPMFWVVVLPIVSFLVPISLILFSRYFIGWGYKKSILWLLIYSILHGFLELYAQISEPALDVFKTSNTIFGFLAAIVLFANLFHSMMKKNREIQIIGAGLGLFLLSLVYDSFASKNWVPDRYSFSEVSYFVFNLCLIYVAIKRITKTEKEFLAVRQDLETAKSIQNAILPHNEPKGELYEVSSVYIPMALIGGDYYDYHIEEEGQIGVLIADVSGHGIGAALIASMMKVAFNSQSNNVFNPAKVLQKMNMGLTGQLNNEFITAAYMGIDLHKKELIYSSAGHPPMIMYKRESNCIEEVKVKGIPIGVFDNTDFIQTKIAVEKGDRLVLYTDGILDVFNPQGKPFGKEQFINHIKDTNQLLSGDVVKSMIDCLRKWSEKKEDETHDDDITLIVFDIL